MMGPRGSRVRYLFGDSSESDLDYNFLAFLREAIDCAVVMLEAELTLGENVERRRDQEQETAGMIRAVEELGKEAAMVVEPVAKQQSRAPVGRCAAAIANAIREAVARESAQAKSALAATREEVDQDDHKARLRAQGMLEKLVRGHDLPGAEKQYEIVWAGVTPKATLRQKTAFGLEAVVVMDVPAGSLLASDLRVERIDTTVEVHTHEAGGWLKKSEKLVGHRLGRYQVIGISIHGDIITVKLRTTPEPSAGLIITAQGKNISIEGTGNNSGKQFSIEDSDRAGVHQLVDHLAKALRGLEQRSALLSAELDGKPLEQHAHPKLIAERLIAAMAPTVQKIIKHGRSPGELVLRRQLADDRREELFVSIAELVAKVDVLPKHARAPFAPLQLGIDIDDQPVERKRDTKPPEVRLMEPKKKDTKPPEPVRMDVKPLDLVVYDAKPSDWKLSEAKLDDIDEYELKLSNGTPDAAIERPVKPTDTKPYEASGRSPSGKTVPPPAMPERKVTPTWPPPASAGEERKKSPSSASVASAIAPAPAREKPKTVPPPAALRPAADTSQPILVVKPVGSAPAKPDKDDADDTASPK